MTMSIMKEFKEFAVKGNVVDMAVAIIIGGAFGKIVSSVVDDIIMPPIGMAVGGVWFSNLFVALDGAVYESLALAREAGAPVLAYGSFLQTVLDFIIIAMAIFMMIKAMNSIKKKEEAAPAETPAQEVLLAEIRDLLAKK